MLLKHFILVSLAVFGASASPKKKYKASGNETSGDVETLNTLLRLEHFLSGVFTIGLANLTRETFTQEGFEESVFRDVQTIARSEAEYVTTLNELVVARGLSPAVADEYQFPFRGSARSFLQVASTVKRVAVSTLLEVAATLADPEYRKTVTSILAMQARHASFLRTAVDRTPFDTAFETPILLRLSLTGAFNFIVGNSTEALPFLFTDCTDLLDPNTSGITFISEVLQTPAALSAELFVVILSGLEQTTVPVTPNGTSVRVETVPEGITGSAYFGITTDPTGADQSAIISELATIDIEEDGTLVSGQCVNRPPA